MRRSVIDELVAKHIPENAYPEQWDTAGLEAAVREVLTLDLPVQDWAKEEGIADEEVRERIERRADEFMAGKVAKWGPDVMRYVEKSILLQTLDHLWREHLVMLEHLRQVIGLRGYGQRDPLNEYQAEAFALFETLVSQPARGGHRPAHAGRDRAAAGRGRGAGRASLYGGAQGRSADRRGRNGARQCAARRRDGRRQWRPCRARRAGRAQCRKTPPPGARSAATSPAPAAPARNSSTATASTSERGPANSDVMRRSSRIIAAHR